MKHLTTLLLTLLVLGGCSLDYDKCVEIETENIRIKDMENLGIEMENARIRAENICFKEPSNFKNEEEVLKAIAEEENCIDIHVELAFGSTCYGIDTKDDLIKVKKELKK